MNVSSKLSVLTGIWFAGVVAVLYVASTGALCDSQLAAEAEGILAHQHAYFQSISSLEFRLTTTQDYAGEGSVGQRTTSTETKFIHVGGKYLVEVTPMNTGAGAGVSVTRAYDGELYQTLASNGGKKQLIVSRARPERFHYGNAHPLLTLEYYATGCGKENSIAGMKRAGGWSELAPSVSSISQSAIRGWDGVERTGTVLRMRRPYNCGEGSESEIEYSVVLDPDLGYLPSRWEATTSSGRWFDCHVADVAKIRTASGEIAFPLRLERTFYGADGELTGTMTLEVDKDSLRVNEPVDESVFTLPRIGTYYIDVDAGIEMQL